MNNGFVSVKEIIKRQAIFISFQISIITFDITALKIHFNH